MNEPSTYGSVLDAEVEATYLTYAAVVADAGVASLNTSFEGVDENLTRMALGIASIAREFVWIRKLYVYGRTFAGTWHLWFHVAGRRTNRLGLDAG